jgi:hypothetical protein
MLIGIAGPSCSGKSTVASQVAHALSGTLLHLDGRWVSGALKPVVSGHRSYERPHQYDGASLLRDALEALGRNPPVVIEGFLLFCYPGIAEACTHRFFLGVPHRELVARRRTRATAGGDAAWGPCGGRNPDADTAWLAHGREEWERFGAPQASIPGMHVIDASRPASQATSSVMATIMRQPYFPPVGGPSA